MTLEEIKSLFPKPTSHEIQHRDGLRVRLHATQKNHRHIHGTVWLPATPKTSPAKYRRLHMGKKKTLKGLDKKEGKS